VVCLARFEQDPMNEVLNLWSPILKENQVLNLQLHPLQKQVNQVKLVESLEDINVQTVNEVGVDINLLVEHEHFHNQLQFLSGLGPRKALRYIQNLKARKPIYNRDMIKKENILGDKCFGSSAGFTKVRVPLDKR
jgi:transcription elongation factor SPT6